MAVEYIDNAKVLIFLLLLGFCKITENLDRIH